MSCGGLRYPVFRQTVTVYNVQPLQKATKIRLNRMTINIVKIFMLFTKNVLMKHKNT